MSIVETSGTNPFKTTLKQDIVESLFNSFQNNGKDYYYLFVAKTSEWSTGDNTPPTSNTDTLEADVNVWREMIGVKKISKDNVTYVIPRYDWISGEIYDEYVHDDSLFDENSPKQFYVLVDESRVYKCISNNNDSESIAKPLSTGIEIETTSDGYRWKFMYEITENTYKFLTNEYMPVQYITEFLGPELPDERKLQWAVQEGAVDGAIDHIKVLTLEDLTLTNLPNFDRVVTTPDSLLRVISDTQIQLPEKIIDNQVLYSSEDGYYVGYTIHIVAGSPGAGQGRYITDYDGETRIITVSKPFDILPIAGKSKFQILPTIIIEGDGSFAEAKPEMKFEQETVIDEDENGCPITVQKLYSIESISMTNVGSNYTYATVKIVVPSPDISVPIGNPDITYRTDLAKAIISPIGGHGSNAPKEMGARHIMLVGDITQNENNDITTENDFRIFGIVKNPILQGGSYDGFIAGSELEKMNFLYLKSNEVTYTEVEALNGSMDSVYSGDVVFQVKTTALDYKNSTELPDSDDLIAFGKIYSKDDVSLLVTNVTGQFHTTGTTYDSSGYTASPYYVLRSDTVLSAIDDLDNNRQYTFTGSDFSANDIVVGKNTNSLGTVFKYMIEPEGFSGSRSTVLVRNVSGEFLPEKATSATILELGNYSLNKDYTIGQVVYQGPADDDRFIKIDISKSPISGYTAAIENNFAAGNTFVQFIYGPQQILKLGSTGGIGGQTGLTDSSFIFGNKLLQYQGTTTITADVWSFSYTGSTYSTLTAYNVTSTDSSFTTFLPSYDIYRSEDSSTGATGATGSFDVASVTSSNGVTVSAQVYAYDFDASTTFATLRLRGITGASANYFFKVSGVSSYNTDFGYKLGTAGSTGATGYFQIVGATYDYPNVLFPNNVTPSGIVYDWEPNIGTTSYLTLINVKKGSNGADFTPTDIVELTLEGVTSSTTLDFNLESRIFQATAYSDSLVEPYGYVWSWNSTDSILTVRTPVGTFSESPTGASGFIFQIDNNTKYYIKSVNILNNYVTDTNKLVQYPILDIDKTTYATETDGENILLSDPNWINTRTSFAKILATESLLIDVTKAETKTLNEIRLGNDDVSTYRTTYNVYLSASSSTSFTDSLYPTDSYMIGDVSGAYGQVVDYRITGTGPSGATAEVRLIDVKRKDRGVTFSKFAELVLDDNYSGSFDVGATVYQYINHEDTIPSSIPYGIVYAWNEASRLLHLIDCAGSFEETYVDSGNNLRQLGNTGFSYPINTVVNDKGDFLLSETVSYNSNGLTYSGFGHSISTVQKSELKYLSGDVLYIQNIKPVSRNIEQAEEFKIVIGF